VTGPRPSLPDRDGCLFYPGAANTSSERYDTVGYHVHLDGNDLADHHLTHLHEIHHKALNDDTARGLALHIPARHRRWSSALYRLGGRVTFAHCAAVASAIARAWHRKRKKTFATDDPSSFRTAPPSALMPDSPTAAMAAASSIPGQTFSRSAASHSDIKHDGWRRPDLDSTQLVS
jgi:hypothetical protein